MRGLSRFKTYVVAGAGACGGAVLLYYGIQAVEKRKAHTSWTTNHISISGTWDYNWDRMAPASLVKPSKGDSDDDIRYDNEINAITPKATRHLLLVRHGQYQLNGKTDEERTLTELGRQQAHITGQRLKELDHSYTTLIRSTMTRAIETAELIETSLPAIPGGSCCMLQEGAPIPPEPPVGHWKPEMVFYQDGPRIEAAFRKYFHRAPTTQKKDSVEILVCHANVIRYFVCRALQFPAEGWLRMSLSHCSITWISISPSGRVILRSLGDVGHIPTNLRTS